MKRIYLIIVTVLFLTWQSFAHISPDMHFTHIDAGDGLTIGSVTSICFDGRGVTWVGTGYGLNSYDGNSVRQHIHTDHSNSILKLCTDSDDNLYVACAYELYKMNLPTGECTTLFPRTCRAVAFRECLYAADGVDLLMSEQDGSFSRIYSVKEAGNVITAILAPQTDSSIWLGTRNGSLIRITEDSVNQWQVGSYVESLYMDSAGDVYVATMSHGLGKVDKSGKLSYLNKKLSSQFVRCMCEDDDGNLWVGTYLGLDCVEKESGRVVSFKPDLGRTDAISHESIWSINKDNQGTLWVGTFFGGINILNPSYEIYRRYHVGPDGLSSPVIGKITAAKGNLVLIATEGGGLNVYDRRTRKNVVYRKGASVRNISENNIKDFYYDSEANTVWLGTHLGGVNRVDLNTGETRVYVIDEAKNINANDILSVVKYGDSFILTTRDGYWQLNPHTGRSERLDELEPFRSSSCVEVDVNGNLWLSGRGITRYNLATGEYKTYIENERISSMLEDRNSNIWACGHGTGLYVYNLPLDRFDYIPFGEEWPRNEICISLVESASSGNLIVAAQKGFGIYDKKTTHLRFYGKEKGFPLANTNQKALASMPDGTVFIGGTTGLVSFKEEELNRAAKPYKIFYTGLYVNGMEENPGGEILKEDIIYTSDITLPNWVSFFTLEFSSSNSILSLSDDFEYRLEGFSDDWVGLRGARSISFSNLSPGNYKLFVRAKGERACAPAEVSIKVLPPWYRTPLAVAGFVILAILLVYGLLYTVKFRLRLKTQEDLHASKLRFFTNISHEIRTPLTMIISQVESLMNDHNLTHADYRKILSLYKNSLSLRELVSELLEFRKQEQGYMKIKVRPHNIVSLAHEHYCLFNELAITKGVNLVFEKDIDRLEVWYDQQQMSKVLSNILSNSLKYTSGGGSIYLKVWAQESEAVMEISDTGCGIPAKDIDKIFDRFYRVNEGDELDTGTGIGLSLSRGIVELHKGRIVVDSKEGVGTVFKIILPLGYSHFDKSQLTSETVEEHTLNVVVDKNDEVVQTRGHEYKVVVAEDNEDIRNMLVELFSPFYTVYPAQDGAEALKLVQSQMPSLVVSDVIMPNMSGTELCREIKNDVSTCHIPVVLLTARVTLEQNLEGLLLGADDYITKPFNSKLLISRCNNLINSRILLQEKYRETPQMPAKALATNKLDKEFLDRVTSIIGTHLSDPDFNVATFANEMAMSRTSLFDKIKAVTGKTPNDFVMTIRLREAVSMLVGNPELSITEISERTGFSSARYFSSCFKNHYKSSPLQYRKSHLCNDLYKM